MVSSGDTQREKLCQVIFVHCLIIHNSGVYMNIHSIGFLSLIIGLEDK
jgi:hypothetical protein